MKKTSKLASLTLALTCATLLSTSACLKRVAVPTTPDQIEGKQVIYVILNSGLEYRLTDAEIQNGLLVGMVDNKEVKIPLADVKAIEVVQQNKKKIIWGTAIGAATILTLGLILSTQSPIHVGSVD